MRMMIIEQLGDGTEVRTPIGPDDDPAVVVTPDGEVYGPYPSQAAAGLEGLSHHPVGSTVRRLWLPVTDREYESDMGHPSIEGELRSVWVVKRLRDIGSSKPEVDVTLFTNEASARDYIALTFLAHGFVPWCHDPEEGEPTVWATGDPNHPDEYLELEGPPPPIAEIKDQTVERDPLVDQGGDIDAEGSPG